MNKHMRLPTIMSYPHLKEQGQSHKNDLDEQERLNHDRHTSRIAIKNMNIRHSNMYFKCE